MIKAVYLGNVTSDALQAQLNTESGAKAGVTVIKFDGEEYQTAPNTENPGTQLRPTLIGMEREWLIDNTGKNKRYAGTLRRRGKRFDTAGREDPDGQFQDWMKWVISLDRETSAKLTDQQQADMERIVQDVLSDKGPDGVRSTVMFSSMHTDTGNSHIHIWSHLIAVNEEARTVSNVKKLDKGPSYLSAMAEKLSSAFMDHGLPALTDMINSAGVSIYLDRRVSPEAKAAAADAVRDSGGVPSENLRDRTPGEIANEDREETQARADDAGTKADDAQARPDGEEPQSESADGASAATDDDAQQYSDYFKAEMAKMQRQKANLERDVLRASAGIVGVDSAMAALTQAEELRISLEAATAQRDELESSLAARTGELGEANEAIASITAELEKALAALNEATNNNATLSSSNQALTEELLTKNATIEAQTATAAEVRDLLDTSPTTIPESANLVDAADLVVEKFTEESAELAESKTELASARAEISRLTDDLEQSRDASSKLETALSKIEASFTALKDVNADQETTIQDLTQQVKTAEGERKTATKKLQATTAALSTLQAHSDDQSRTIEGQVTEIGELKTAMAALKEETAETVSTMRNEVQAVREQITALREEMNGLVVDNTRLIGNETLLKSQLAAANESAGQLKEQQNYLRTEIEEQKAALAGKDDRIAALIASLGERGTAPAPEASTSEGTTKADKLADDLIEGKPNGKPGDEPTPDK